MIRPITFGSSVLLFGVPTIFFFVVAYGIMPFLTEAFHVHPAMAWFIGGTMIFSPLFAVAIMLARRDGFRSATELSARLRLRSMSPRDWKYTIVSLVIIGALTGIIMGVAHLLHVAYEVPALRTTPPFMEFEPFAPSERWILGAWLAMFFFNIAGEELLWRGYIQPRQEASFGTYAWSINAALWMMFHLGMGISLMILVLPIIVVLPYAVQKTGNTVVGMLIHALLNGPSFVMISLGVIG